VHRAPHSWLLLNAGKVLSDTALAEHIYNELADHDSNVVQYFISRLRSKLDPMNRLKPLQLRGLAQIVRTASKSISSVFMLK
jgi:DNA-binding response OmpR family regulator